MKRLLFSLVLQVLILPVYAQFSDDFSSGTLSDVWLGDVDRFAVLNEQLQLNDLDPGGSNTSVLYALAPTSTAEETTWSLQVRCDFSPSSSNFATVYLAADQVPSPGGNWNGYFLKVGGISGGDDALELHRQDGSSSTVLISGLAGAVASDPVTVGILVTRTSAGEWTLEADYTGGEDYDEEGTATDATYTSGLYFGFACRYSSTRSMAFFFDNVLVDPVVTDEDPPVAQSVSPEGSDQVIVQFAEPLADNSISNPANYSLDNGVGAATNAVFVNGDRSRVGLTFGESLTNLTTYTLAILNAEDLAGNINPAQTISFEYLLPEEPAPGDLIFTEIFPDPTPPVGLPDFEYVELYNNSNKVLSLGGLGLSTGSSPREINDALLLPDSYIILCDVDAVGEFETFGEIASLESFPALTNGGDDLILTTSNGTELAALVYDITWYQDPLRAAGGYALELIELDLPNDCPGNWRASDATIGGTPGTQNSVIGMAVESDAPQLLRAFAPNASQIFVQFDEVLESTFDLTANFSISPSLAISSATLQPDRQNVRITLVDQLAENTVYELTVAAGITDCVGNMNTSSSSVLVGLSAAPKPGELVINEVLFNPFVGGVDYLELYNLGPAILNLQGLRLRNEAITSGTLATIVENDFVLLPDSYVVFTSDPLNVLQEYTVPNPAALIENSLPSMGDDEGNITVYNANLEVLDALDYTRDWHSRLLSDRNGVSLERLRADAPTQNEGNWHSAASTVGFGTPTGINSQDRATVVPPTEDFFVLPEQTFSPDQDGFQDVLEIQYSTDQAGYLVQLLIFDAQGRQVRRLDDLELLAGSGSFIWDGTTDDEERARIGIYILVAEIFTPEGETITEKHTCVVAGQLD
ncbi:MAG: Ig-like domain-containing protein [Bacteroidota bacterium]